MDFQRVILFPEGIWDTLRHLFIWDTSLCSQVGLLPSWKDRNRSTRPGLSINKWWPNKNNVTLIFKQQHYPKINKNAAKSIKNRIPKSQDNIHHLIYIDISIFPKLGFFANAPFHQGSVVRMGFFCNSSALAEARIIQMTKWPISTENVAQRYALMIDTWLWLIMYYIHTHISIQIRGPKNSLVSGLENSSFLAFSNYTLGWYLSKHRFTIPPPEPVQCCKVVTQNIGDGTSSVHTWRAWEIDVIYFCIRQPKFRRRLWLVSWWVFPPALVMAPARKTRP